MCGKIVQIPHLTQSVICGRAGQIAYFKCRPFFRNHIFRCSWAAHHKIVISFAALNYFSFPEQRVCSFFLCPKFIFHFFEKSNSKAAPNSQYSVGMVILCVTSGSVCWWFSSFMSSTKWLIDNPNFYGLLIVPEQHKITNDVFCLYSTVFVHLNGFWHHKSQHVLVLWTVLGIIDANTQHKKILH